MSTSADNSVNPSYAYLGLIYGKIDQPMRHIIRKDGLEDLTLKGSKDILKEKEIDINN